MKRPTIVIGAIAIAVATGARGQVPTDVAATVRDIMAKHHIPGLALAVVRNGKIARAAGFGTASIEHSAPVSPDTVFEIGSISKAFSAVAVMALVEDGLLDLDKPASSYLPGMPDSWRGITSRHLMTHTAGLWDWDGTQEFSYRAEYTDEQYIALLAGHPPEFAPGEKYVYTNGGYPLVGMIVRRVSGRSYEEYTTERLFRRAGLTRTTFRDAREVVKGRADGYVWKETRWERGEPLRPKVIAPNGGILSTANEMARFDLALASGRILKPETMRKMWTAPRLANGSTSIYALGWFVDKFKGKSVIHHIGETVGGHSASYQRFPDDNVTVIVLANIRDVLPVYLLSRTIAATELGLMP